MTDHPPAMRINKYLAHHGYASRREADELVRRGEVFVNGRPAVLGETVSDTDTVVVQSEHPKQHQYLAYYKGRGIIAHSPEEHETNIATRLSHDYGLSGVYPIGRLDKDSEGLLLISNDGRLTGPLLDPEAHHEKEYEVTVDKPVTSSFLHALQQGVDIEGYTTKPARAEKISEKQFRLVLTEGKKHQIRRMCAALGYQVNALKRVRIMHITLGKLKPNQYRKLTDTEIKKLRTELGLKIQ